jgi:hypothetical protein
MYRYIVEVVDDGRKVETHCFTLSGARDVAKMARENKPHSKVRIFELFEVVE